MMPQSYLGWMIRLKSKWNPTQNAYAAWSLTVLLRTLPHGVFHDARVHADKSGNLRNLQTVLQNPVLDTLIE